MSKLAESAPPANSPQAEPDHDPHVDPPLLAGEDYETIGATAGEPPYTGAPS
jgi:hypothetical protein